MSDAQAHPLPLLWDPPQLALPQWDGQAKGVYQTTGNPLVCNEVVALRPPDPSNAKAASSRVFVSEAWDPHVEGVGLAHFEYGGHVWPAAVRQEQAVLLNFDFAGSIEATLYERYRRERRPLATYLPLPYHRVLPRPVRRPIRRLEALVRGGPRPGGFPEWPVTMSLLHLMRLVPRGGPQENWPGSRRFALVLTHDVESSAGIRLADELAKVEADHGVRSTWFIAGRLAAEARNLADRLKAEGHEIGLHGVEHDMVFPFRSRSDMEKRLESCRHFIDDYGIRGFRSPALLKSDLMYEVLGEWFAYDSSAVDTGRLSPHTRPTGCCSVFPFRRGKLIVVPITLPLDSSLLFLGYGLGDMPGLWNAKATFIRAARAPAVLATHPEPHFSGSSAGLAAYAAFLESTSQLGPRWDATLAELVDFLSHPEQATQT